MVASNRKQYVSVNEASRRRFMLVSLKRPRANVHASHFRWWILEKLHAAHRTGNHLCPIHFDCLCHFVTLQLFVLLVSAFLLDIPWNAERNLRDMMVCGDGKVCPVWTWFIPSRFIEANVSRISCVNYWFADHFQGVKALIADPYSALV